MKFIKVNQIKNQLMKIKNKDNWSPTRKNKYKNKNKNRINNKIINKMLKIRVIILNKQNKTS